MAYFRELNEHSEQTGCGLDNQVSFSGRGHSSLHHQVRTVLLRLTERHGRVISTPGFKRRSGDRLYRLRFFVVSLRLFPGRK
jgi:hypothetical protein